MNFSTILEELDKLYDESTTANTEILDEAVTKEYQLVNKFGTPVVKDVFGSKEVAVAYANKYNITDVYISCTELVDGQYNGHYKRSYIDKNGKFVESLSEEVDNTADETDIEIAESAAAEAVDADEEEIDIEIVDDPEFTKSVLECAECGGFDVVESDAIVVDDESDFVNVGTACRYCEAKTGFTIVGGLVTVDNSADEAAAEADAEDDSEPTDTEADEAEDSVTEE